MAHITYKIVVGYSDKFDGHIDYVRKRIEDGSWSKSIADSFAKEGLLTFNVSIDEKSTKTSDTV
jgi:hypothetical protein